MGFMAGADGRAAEAELHEQALQGPLYHSQSVRGQRLASGLCQLS